MMSRKHWILPFVFFAAAIAAYGQGVGRTAGGAAATGSVGGDLGGQPGLNSGGGFNSGPATQPQSGVARPLFISGKVVQASGEIPPEPVLIKRVCGSQSYAEGYTDSKGGFSFQVGGNTSLAVMDAEIGSAAPGVPQGSAATVFTGREGDLGTGVDLSGCFLEADAPGFRSEPIFLTRRRPSDRPDVGSIILTPISDTRAAVSATSLAVPKKARAAFDKAIKELNKGSLKDYQKAFKELDKAVELYPEYAAAWTIMGQAKHELGDHPGAEAAYEKALAADQDYLRPYEPMILLTVDKQDWQRTTELADAYLEADRTNIKVLWYNAVAQYELGRHDEALESLDAVQADDTGAKQYPQTHHIKGLIYTQRGQFSEAVEELEEFLELSPDSPAAESIRKQIQEWKELGAV